MVPRPSKVKQYHASQIAHHHKVKYLALRYLGFGIQYLQHCTRHTPWSHQYGKNKCAFNEKADELAKQVAATQPLQLRPRVLRRPRQRLASSETHNVRPGRSSASVIAGVQQRLPGQAMQRAQSRHLSDGRDRDQEPSNGGIILQSNVSQKLSSSSAHV